MASRSKVPRPCVEPHCSEYAITGNRCEEHQIERESQKARKARGLTGQRGSTYKWRRLREIAWRAQRGICAGPGCRTKLNDPTSENGKDGAPWDLHHKDGNSKNDAPDNLEGRCKPCHVKTFIPGGARKRRK